MIGSSESTTVGLSRSPNIPHYYGDRVRELFVIAAVVSFVVIPLWGDLLPYGTFTQVIAGVLLVLLAGLTNPHSKAVLVADAIVSGVSVLLLETTAISLHLVQSTELFLARELSAVLLLVAFYFSVKTLRAMALGKTGKGARPNEFSDHQNTLS